MSKKIVLLCLLGLQIHAHAGFFDTNPCSSVYSWLTDNIHTVYTSLKEYPITSACVMVGSFGLSLLGAWAWKQYHTPESTNSENQPNQYQNLEIPPDDQNASPHDDKNPRSDDEKKKLYRYQS